MSDTNIQTCKSIISIHFGNFVNRLDCQVFQVKWKSADPVSDFENGEGDTKLASRHIREYDCTRKVGVANVVLVFTVRSLVTSLERASAQGIVKDHGLLRIQALLSVNFRVLLSQRENWD